MAAEGVVELNKLKFVSVRVKVNNKTGKVGRREDGYAVGSPVDGLNRRLDRRSFNSY